MRSINIILTNICNLHCSFCLRNASKDSLDIKLIKKFLKEIKKYKYDCIAVTGGEPFTHPEFYKVIEAIVKEGFSFGIASNGFHYKKYEPLLDYGDKFRYITFSIDSSIPEHHDKFRGKNSFKKVCEAVKFFSPKMRVMTSICLSKYNFKELEDTIRLCENLGASEVRCMGVIPKGKDEICLSDEEKLECVKRITKLNKNLKINIRILSSLKTAPGVNFCKSLGLIDLTVNALGELIFCCDTIGDGAVIGSIKKEAFVDMVGDGFKISHFLKEKRSEHINKKEFFKGFNSCVFCNKYLIKDYGKNTK